MLPSDYKVEIGRGTSSCDGLSLAQATLEYLHSNNRCLALFATHYQELSKCIQYLEAVKCCKMDVSVIGSVDNSQTNCELLFKYKLVPGVVESSYGIAVAKLAKLPKKVIDRAHSLLREIKQNRQA